jgi:hypothetical protein
MIQTIPANQVTLRTLKEQFGLQLSQDGQFFPEWRQANVRLSETEEQILERVTGVFRIYGVICCLGYKIVVGAKNFSPLQQRM